MRLDFQRPVQDDDCLFGFRFFLSIHFLVVQIKIAWKTYFCVFFLRKRVLIYWENSRGMYHVLRFPDL